MPLDYDIANAQNGDHASILQEGPQLKHDNRV